MDILIVQPDIIWMDPTGNLRRLDGILKRAITGGEENSVDPDLIVLPEMFATGFCMDAALASETGVEVMEWMRTTAGRYDAAVAGTVAVGEGEHYYNRFCFILPDGSTNFYDKRHLFTFGGENTVYTPGKERVTVEWRDWRILLQTCYDLRFPVFSRNRGDYDLALYCASWPEKRIAVWDTLIRARAIENAAYVVGVNRVGTDPGNMYPGHSAAVDFKGVAVAELPEGERGCIRCRLSAEELRRFREKFPVLGDADRFAMEL
ncbi:MAG: amidohydrolase [Rikenellaceae bacterium]|nr:amidohydrolase [Rikenellaceae bacterium]